MSGKSGAHRHHRKNYKPAPGKPERAFSFRAARLAELVSILRIWFAEFSVKILTRRANQRHNAIIARILKSPRRKTAAGFFVSRFGRRPARHGATSFERNLPERRRRAAVRASMTP
jgi:hypothetical protein